MVIGYPFRMSNSARIHFSGRAGGKRGVRYYAVSTNDEGGVLFAVHLFLQGVGVGGVCGRGSMQ